MVQDLTLTGPASGLPCLLCGHPQTIVVRSLTGHQLRALWRCLDREFSDAAWGTISEVFTVEQRCCVNCGFRSFPPSLAGNGIFYAELDRAGYYSSERPEFERTTTFARRRGLRRVLDIGCGSGCFLDQVRAAGCETYGLELNTAAAAKAESKGHKMFSGLLHELDPKTTGKFDLITLFQVLEHVPDPVNLLQHAANFVNPGGFIAVAVPNAEGIYRMCPWEPHQWPPHHVSWWRPADFNTLARTTRLNLVEAGGDILVGSLIRDYGLLHNRLASAIGQPRRFGGELLPRAIAWGYRKTGMKHVFPCWGGSIYAYFQLA